MTEAAGIGVILASTSWLVAAGEINPWIPSGIGFGAFLAILALLWKIQRGYIDVQDHKIALTNLEAREAKFGEQLCEWRLGRLTNWMREQGHGVPDNLYDDIPLYLVQQQDRLARERENLDA